MPKTANYDVVVVGAGVAGLSIAALLSKTQRVVILERESAPMYHSTSRSAALLIENYGGDVMEQFIRGSRPFLENPPTGFCDSPILKPRGVLNLVTHDNAADFDNMSSSYQSIDVLTPEDLREWYPYVQSEKFVGAVLEKTAMDLDVDVLCQAYLRQCKSNGGELVCNAGVETISKSGDVWQVKTTDGVFKAPLMVNAAGAWADELAKLAGAKPLDLIPHRRSAAIVEFKTKLDSSGPMLADSAETWYAKPEGDWLMVSLADETPVPPCDIWPEDIDIATAIDNFQQAVDVGEVLRLVQTWAGLRTFAPDRHPVVGFDASVDGFFWLAGQGGSGIHAGPALAESAARLITGASPPDWFVISDAAIESLSPKRFSTIN
ncbi:MAG: FAD-binding oxidoreductase [Pseudomonadota bacterium]